MSATTVPLLQRRLQRSASLSRTRWSSRTKQTTTIETTSPPAEGCICKRPNVTIICRNCGWNRCESRTRILCPVHVMTFYLYDIEFCPKCHAYPPILMECAK